MVKLERPESGFGCDYCGSPDEPDFQGYCGACLEVRLRRQQGFGQLANPEDANYFGVGLTWPPPTQLRADGAAPGSVVLVCTAVDRERGVVTYTTAKPCDQTWPLQPCEVKT